LDGSREGGGMKKWRNGRMENWKDGKMGK